MYCFLHLRRHRGLTLIELMVVVALIGSMMVIMLPHYRNFKCQRSVDYWADMIVSDLNYMKQKTLLTEMYWGMEIDNESSYRFSVSDDGSYSYDPPKKVLRRMDRDFAGSTSFLPGINTVFFGPRASIGTMADSSWSQVAIFRNSVLQMAEFSFSIKSGPFQRTIKVMKNGECRVAE